MANIPQFTPNWGAVGNVTPFTHRDNATYLTMLHDLSEYLTATLIPAINEEFSEQRLASTTEVLSLLTDVNTLITTLNTTNTDAETAHAAVILIFDSMAPIVATAQEHADAAALSADAAAAAVSNGVGLVVTDFGAVMDGVTDSTQAFIDAHAALPSSGGKIVVPSGEVVISSEITFTKTVIVEGLAVATIVSGGSVVLCAGAGSLKFTGQASGARDLMVLGVTGNTGVGITLMGGRPWLNNVSVVGQGSHGVIIGSDTVAVNVNLGNLSHVRLKENIGDGLYITHPNTSLPDNNVININGADLGYNGGNGLTIRNAFDTTIVGAAAEGNDGYGVQLINSTSNMFLKMYLEANTLGEFVADETSTRNYVIGHRRDQRADVFVFANTQNFILGFSPDAIVFPYANAIYGGTVGVVNPTISGNWAMEQDDGRDLVLWLEGTGALANITAKSRGDSGIIGWLLGKFSVGGGATVTGIFKNAATLSVGTIPANSTKDLTISAVGADVNATVQLGISSTLASGITFCGFVTSAGTVTARFANSTPSSVVVGNIATRVLATNFVL